MYTSGTTGEPKAVVLSHRSWRAVADRAEQVLDMGAGEVTLHVAPLTHGAGFLLLPTLRLGGHNVLCKSFDAGRTLRLFEEYDVTGLFVVPSMIRMLLDARSPEWTVPRSLRRLYYAGSPIDPTTLREAVEVFQGRIVQSFAQMESPMFFTVLDRGDHLRATQDPDSPLVRSAGRVLPGVELLIADEAGQPQAHGVPGEILAKAPQTMSGYWNRPEATASALADGWLHTGDVGHLDADGYLYIVDRTKDMIVTGGSNVYAREVEEVLVELPGVQEAAVVGVPHRIWGEAVTAVLVAAGDPDSDAVVTGCRERLAGYKVPKEVVWVKQLPRNAYGKVLKRELRERLAAGARTAG
jgi:acyl-CoA synthetase (AMP-forming)/AMP-acid ligase II